MYCRFLSTLLVLIISIQLLEAKSFTILKASNSFDGSNANTLVSPGDTILLEGGVRSFLSIKNVLGTAQNPVYILVNSALLISTDHYYGLSIQQCSYFILDGSVHQEQGLKISSPKGVAIGIGYGSSDYEIAHIEIDSTDGAGILAKSDPNCAGEYTRDKFKSKNIKLHDLKISNTGTEGIYFGSTFYDGQTINCNGKDTIMFPHITDSVEIYNCYIYRSGWDGIQVSSAYHAKVYNNLIEEDSQKQFDNQMNGIIIGTGTNGKFFNNVIIKGSGTGILSFASDSLYLFNNIIYGCGINNSVRGGRYGIYIDDRSTVNNTEFLVVHNTILHFRDEGLRFIANNQTNNYRVSHNVFAFYNNSTSNSFVVLQGKANNVLTVNNFYTHAIDSLNLDTTVLRRIKITAISPVIDKSFILNIPDFRKDIYGNPRPINGYVDWGAEEYNGTTAIGYLPERTQAIHYLDGKIAIDDVLKIESLDITDISGNSVLNKFCYKLYLGKCWLECNENIHGIFMVHLNQKRYKIIL